MKTRYKFYRVFSALILLITLCIPAKAQILDNKGTDFYMAFMPNLSSPAVEVHLTADANTMVTVEYPAISPTFTTTVAAGPGVVTIVSLPVAAAQGWAPGTVQNNLVHAFATQEFVAYMINRAPATSDAALALPKDAMNTQYITLNYFSNINGADRSEFAIAAPFDNTTVTITPEKDLVGGFPAGVPFDIALNAGQGFLGQATTFGSAGDLTGTIIESDKPLGVTNGNTCTNVPPNTFACDHIFEVAQPLQSWGNQVLVSPLPNRPSGSVYRILSSADNTTISQDGAVLGTVDMGGFIETAVIPGPHVFDADNPIFVAQYMTGQSFAGASSGDPAMGNIVPTEQYLQAYTFSTVGGGQFVQNFVSIIAQNSDVAGGTIFLDGAPVAAGDFSPIPGTSFSYSAQTLTSGSHSTSSNGFHGITVEGYNSFDSYIFPGGAKFQFINPVVDNTAPICSIQHVNSTVNGSATDNGPDDSGIFFVQLDPGSINLNLDVDPFVPGDGMVAYQVTLIDPNQNGSGTVRVTDGSGNSCTSDIQINVAPGAIACTDADIHIAGFDADQGANDTMEWVRVSHNENQPVDLSLCHFAVFNGRNDRSTFTMALTGMMGVGDDHLLGNPAVPNTDQTFPNNTLLDQFAAISILTVPAPPRTTPGAVAANVKAAIVYFNENMIFGQVPAPPTKNGGDLTTMMEQLRIAAVDELPESISLEQNYPNPFNPSTTIHFRVPEEARVELVVFDVLGHRIRTLLDGSLDAGSHEVVWDGRDEAGKAVASGVYVYRLQADDFVSSRRMMLMK